MQREPLPVETPSISLQDIVVATHYTIAGEFGDTTKYGGRSIPEDEPFEITLSRMMHHINGLVKAAFNQHSQQNYTSGQLRPDKKDNIVRLVTNEFYFYTKKPLTLDQFQEVMQRVVGLANVRQPNLHLILASFAVRTADDKVMSVVAHIEGGQSPKLNLIVKNNPSSIDPVYSEKLPDDSVKVLPNVDVRKLDTIADVGILINGISHPFTFDNIVKCTSASGACFYTCVDICLDHCYALAKNNLAKKLSYEARHAVPEVLEQPPVNLLSHVIVANTVTIRPENCLEPNFTHADPDDSHKKCKGMAAFKEMGAFAKVTKTISQFGTRQSFLLTAESPCSPLPAWLQFKLGEDYAHKNKFPAIAKFWYQQAADAGHEEAKEKLARFEERESIYAKLPESGLFAPKPASEKLDIDNPAPDKSDDGNLKR